MKPKAKRKAMSKPAPNMASVENPNWSRAHDGDRTNPRFITVEFNHRESSISVLASKGSLDAAQVAAAVRFRGLWEAMGGAGAGAIDYSKTRVDGGVAPEPISARQMSAGVELNRVRQVVKEVRGTDGYDLVVKIAGEGRSIRDLVRNPSDRRERDTKTDELKACLDVLAELWGFAGKGSVRSRVVSQFEICADAQSV